jgi:hypothetical protein
VCNKALIYRDALLALQPFPNIENHPLLAVRVFLFNVLEATLNLKYINVFFYFGSLQITSAVIT